MAIGVVLISSFWLALFSHKHVQYSHDLWWRFELLQGAPRFLCASVGIAMAAFVFALTKLLRSTQPEPAMPTPIELDKALQIAKQSPDTTAFLALLGGKELLFSKKGDAFLMFAIKGRTWVVMGDPVGPKEECEELLWRFVELCDAHEARPVF